MYEKGKGFVSLKGRSMYLSCKIYKEHFFCKENDLGMTVRSTPTHWDENNSLTHDSESVKHLKIKIIKRTHKNVEFIKLQFKDSL